MASGVVTTQPKTKKSELLGFIRDLDPIEVAEWAEADVIERFLRPIGMDFMAKAFIENKINGAVLMCLNENHMKEMGCAVLGDRILFLDYLTLLKKSKRDSDRSRSLWSGTTPVLKCGYHRNCTSYMTHLCCPCGVPTTEWKVTGQGIRWRRNRASVNCCGDVETQFIDYRFVKDLEVIKQPRCCCFCVGTELRIYADDKDAVSVRQSQSTGQVDVDSEPVSIMHPDVMKAEALIRSAWNEAKLVAD